jgi:hypothetical protein
VIWFLNSGVPSPLSGGSFYLAFPLSRVRGRKRRFEQDRRRIEGEIMKRIFIIVVTIAIAMAIIGAVKPYWNKYWIQKELEAAAVYGTKNTSENTTQFLLSKLEEGGYPVRQDGIRIEKDSKNKVTVTVRYSDRICVFGKELYKLHFTLTATEREIKAYY